MLIISRKLGEGFIVLVDGKAIKISLIEQKGGSVRIGIDAPKECRILRNEIYQDVNTENIQSSESHIVDFEGQRTSKRSKLNSVKLHK